MISIIVPTYNRNHDLNNLLLSLSENSSYKNEIIILSPLGNIKINKVYGNLIITILNDYSRLNGKRIKSLWQIINEGIQISNNKYACWLNDDCLVNKNWDKIAISYFKKNVGLVVFRTKGLNNDPQYKTIRVFTGDSCANYGVMKVSNSLRFDPNYNWYHGDSDISIQCKYIYNLKVVSTRENLIVHNHIEDINRKVNNSSSHSISDKKYYDKKWYWLIKGEKLIRILEHYSIYIYYLRHILSVYYKWKFRVKKLKSRK